MMALNGKNQMMRGAKKVVSKPLSLIMVCALAGLAGGREASESVLRISYLLWYNQGRQRSVFM